jgi:serine/tyrosine/threonine adenylyltransferase
MDGIMNIRPQSAAYYADPKIATFFEHLGGQNKLADPVRAAEFSQAILRFRNDRWADTVGLTALTDTQWLDHFGRFTPLPGNLPGPLALRYHGHQFRHYNPDIGDGRGFLFAQLRDHTGRLMDLGTKGSGTTPYSRSGDGRLTLKGGVREILATEMLEALGVETSKTFSLVETGEALMRGDEPSPTRSAVLVRLNHSHIRIGTFQRIAYENNAELMHALVEYCITHLYNQPPNSGPNTSDAASLLNLAVERIADQAAAFMVAGFVHGVLNTDNINITGESFDYGPWRFTPHWDPRFTAAYFDHNGLYAFGRQAEAMHWNLAQLAVSLRLISDAPPLIAALERYAGLFQDAIVTRFLWRLGLRSSGSDNDHLLVESAERAMIAGKIPIDSFFHSHRAGHKPHLLDPPAPEYTHFLDMLAAYQPIGARDHYWDTAPVCSVHIDEVEEIWSAIDLHDNWDPLHQKIAEIRQLGAALSNPALNLP